MAITSFSRRATYTLWIDKRTFLMVRYDDALGNVTVYRPEPEAAVDPALFRFDHTRPEESPLQDAGVQRRPEGMPEPGSIRSEFPRGG